MAAYDSYKDSGVKWLGKVPSHWEIKKMHSSFFEVKDLNSKRQTSNQLQFKFGTIISKPDCSVDSDVWDTIEKYTVVKPNDIIINGLNLNFDLLSMRVGQVKDLGAITSAYVCLRPKNNVFSSYFLYLLKGMDARKVFHGFGSGIRATLSFKELKNKELAIPPREEQEAIVSYLDNVTAKIDEAIEAQQKMIDALNERKQIIITRAVTRNMDKWYKIPLRFVFEMRNGYTPSKADPSFWENGTIPWYRMEDIRKSGRFLNESIQTISPKAVKSKGTFKAGSYIMAICTASIGEHAMLIADSLANQRFMNFKVHKSLINELSPKFIFYYFYVIGKFCRDNANSTCFQYVDMAALKRYPIPIPSIAEQQDIVTYIEQATSAIDSSLSATEHRLNLLQERKQIIINEVVTGKKKVI